MLSFELGFVSAAAIYSGDDNMRGLSGATVGIRLTGYCLKHPEDNITDAARLFFNSRGGRE